MSGNAPAYEDIYVDLIGFVPPRIQHRLRVERECDPELLDLVEALRTRAMYPESMETKVSQLILFGILLSHVAPAAEYHARGAIRAGATKRELHDVAALAFLFRGLPAFNLAGELINKIYDAPAAE
ncbi:carboxymuconolactone decarboxylase family protein [Xanthobacter dioxanivorans]|uniref:Carboxymuconolactone decarboxylase family protein n=1 Tax=Xanthobacter dioxanivorans TaxID=2528964 RepID=A0A974SJA2_9HYPH|nr:carboxymuconolactone decarboxylase family protein [Xanthobacter dioxanivorans]QRG07029.1 carboxymuconolactone decarboxylase family protein [Xanthobacter dioxanivorans]